MTIAGDGPATPDGYEGLTWRERANLDGLRAVLDSADEAGAKNALIDSIHRTALLNALSPHAPYKRALDFGCGVGRLTPVLLRVAREVDAVDSTPEMVRVTIDRGILPPDRVHLASGVRLPFDACTFDVVVSVYVLSCVIRATFDESLRELHRVMQTGARLVMIEQVSASRGLTKSSYRARLAAAGFHMESARSVRGGSSRIVDACSRGTIPSKLMQAAAIAEIALARVRRYAAYDYCDCLMVAVRR